MYINYISVSLTNSLKIGRKVNNAFWFQRRLDLLQEKINSLRYEILNTSYAAPGGRDSIVWPVGATPENQPSTRFDVLRWDYFTLSHIYPESDFSNLKQLTRADTQDIEV